MGPIVIGPNSILRSAFNFEKLIMNLKGADKYFLDETLECSISLGSLASVYRLNDGVNRFPSIAISFFISDEAR